MTNIPESIQDDHIVLLVTGIRDNNESFWAYLSLLPTRYFDFKAAEERGDYNLRDFGDILESGSGTEPPSEVIQKMKEQHGFDNDFEADLFREIANTRE